MFAVMLFGGWYAVHTLMVEHDARVIAEAQVKISEAQVKTLTDGMTARDTKSAQAQAVIVKVIHDTATVPQAIANMPAVIDTPLPVPVQATASGDMVIPKDDVISIFQQLGDDKLCRSQLVTATADLADTKQIVVAKQTEIAALKKKPSFWKRVKHDLKVAAFGAAIAAIMIH
jgi:hypothetical protein